MFVEACGRQIPWLQPHDVALEPGTVGINLPGDKPGASRGMLSSYHSQSANVAFADGSVRTLSERVGPEVLRAIMTTDGVETIDFEALLDPPSSGHP